MKRSARAKPLPLRTPLLLVCLLFPLSLAAQPREGVHYERLQSPMDSGESEVVEVFSFGCHYCYELEPDLRAWVEDNGLELTRIPFFGNEKWEALGRLYLAMEDQMLTSKARIDAVFEAVHEGEVGPDDLATIVSRLELAPDEAETLLEAARSERIRRRQEEVDTWLKNNRIVNVPSLVLEGRYVSDAARARGNDNLILLADFLMDRGP